MSLREATRFLLWYGEKAIAGEEPTPEETEMFIRARKVSLWAAHNMLRLKPEDYQYTQGRPYK
jgi:hypothetical protein